MSRSLRIETAKVFAPLLEPARNKGAYGGRGSGKSHNFAENMIDDAVRAPGEMGEGLRAVCLREVQKTLAQSAKRLIETKLEKFRLKEADGFKIYRETIQLPKDGLIIFQGLQDHTAESIKSLEGYHRSWCEEAQTLSNRSLTLLRPTIRWEDKGRGLASELWFSWNPRRRVDPVDMMFRGDELPTSTALVRANWSDNPWFPEVLEQERQDCLRITPEQYDHIWEGGYATVLEGAYYARLINEAKLEGRIGVVGADPLMTIRLFVDIGGTGAKADAFSMWAVQFVGLQIRVLNYYEAVGQPLGTHLEWMRSNGYTPDKAQIWLPHDGVSNDKVYDVSYESALIQAGYEVTTVPNQGKGAAKARIESVRRTFSAAWFNETPTEAGLSALGWYHERKDEARSVGLGPEHDWASHGSDAYGLMSIVYEEHIRKPVHTEDYYAAFRR